MAFNYDELSCGFHPDYCSTCTANDCHGACVCSVKPPSPGLLCDMCGGTGCPKCGCEPAPQQTFLSHTRVSFPKCTCDPCPKRCRKCCRKRIACDCLPSDFCRYDPELDDLVLTSSDDNQFDEEEDEPESMNVDPDEDEKMEVDQQPPTTGRNNNNMDRDHSENLSSGEPMEIDTTKSITKKRSTRMLKRIPKKKGVQRRRTTNRSTKRVRSAKSVKSVKFTKSVTPIKSASSAKSVKSVGMTSPLKPIKSGKFVIDQSEDMPMWKKLGYREPTPYEHDPDVILNAEEIEKAKEKAQEIDCNLLSRMEEYIESQAKICNVKKICGPCCPPQPKSEEEKAKGHSTHCLQNCDKPCMPEELLDPCNPRPTCLCDPKCVKEYHMIADNGSCLRCTPKEDTRKETTCIPCHEEKFVKCKSQKKENVETVKDPCDESEVCEDSCQALFGKCLPPPTCVGECTSGECENACTIM